MKKNIILIVSVCFFTQVFFAEAYSLSKENLVKEFGQKYYDLRSQLPFEGESSFNLDEALLNKEKSLNIMLRLINDRTIMPDGKRSLFERLNINASKTVFVENMVILDSIIDLLIFASGYGDIGQAINDNYEKFNEQGKSILEKRIQCFSLFYQKEYKMPKKCADKYSEYVSGANVSSNKYKALLDEGCTDIGILLHYAEALIAEGKSSNTLREANKQVLELYQKYFDGLSDAELNGPTTLTFLREIYFMENSDSDIDTKIIVNKKIADLILSKKLVLDDKPLWIQRDYLTLLSKAMSFNKKDRKEMTEKLKTVTKKKRNIFGFCERDGILQLPNNKQLYSAEQLTNEEKNFLQLIGEKIHPCPEKKKKGINN